MRKLKLNRPWFFFLSIAWIVGILLRVLYVNDMEYKEDEEYNFNQTQLIGVSQPWPWYGIPSGVYLVNPGMSIWVFAILAKLFHIHRPTDLAHALQIFSILGMSLILPFAKRWVPGQDRSAWFWAFALSLVNPFLVLYQRKLWPEPFLPFFSVLVWMGWWNRSQRWGAFLWGGIGAWLGQIHMSGFFLSAGVARWTLLFESKLQLEARTRWKFWFFGSTLGALPLIPWLVYIFKNPIPQSMSTGWSEAVQLKYWVFWFTDPLGLHLGNPLGILRGNSHWAQLSDFIRYPLLGGQATYGVGVAHGVAGLCGLFIFLKFLRNFWSAKPNGLRNLTGSMSSTSFLQNSVLWGSGILLTATGVMIRRYYMAVTYPLEFICLVRMADPRSVWGKRLLITLWVAELFMSAHFVGYIHVNQGAPLGDYGDAYHVNHKP